jgi:hypothetical protein
MRTHPDEAIAEVRAARKALCDRFGNDPHRLLAHLRAEQRQYRGRVIKDWSELEPAATLRETPAPKRKKTAMTRYGINDIASFTKTTCGF